MDVRQKCGLFESLQPSQLFLHPEDDVWKALNPLSVSRVTFIDFSFRLSLRFDLIEGFFHFLHPVLRYLHLECHEFFEVLHLFLVACGVRLEFILEVIDFCCKFRYFLVRTLEFRFNVDVEAIV